MSSLDQLSSMLEEYLRVSHHDDGTLRSHYEVINVRDFGAQGNNAEEDTAAFQAAIEAAANYGGIIFVPANPKPYLVSNLTVEKHHKVAFIGSGYASSVIRQVEDAEGALLRVRALESFKIADIRLERPNNDRKNTGIEAGPDEFGSTADAGTWYDFENVWVVGFETGMIARFLQKGRFSHIHAQSNKIGILVISATTGGAWRDCAAMFNEIGIKVMREASTGLMPVFHMHAGVIEVNSKVGLVLDSVNDVLLEGVFFEANGTKGETPEGAGIEVRQTVGKADVLGHTYIRPHFGYLAGTDFPPAFRINTECKNYGGGQFKSFAIMNPWSPHTKWDLKDLRTSLVIAPDSGFNYDKTTNS